MRASDRLWVCRWPRDINTWDYALPPGTPASVRAILAALEAQETAEYARRRKPRIRKDPLETP